MDDDFDIARVFEIGKFDITRLTCTQNEIFEVKPTFLNPHMTS